MVKLRLKKDEKATTGVVFHITDLSKENAYSYVADHVGKDVADACCLYGFRVYTQKDVAEAGGAGTGRDAALVEKFFTDKGIAYTTAPWVKGEKAVDPRMAKLEAKASELGITVEELLEKLASV